MRNIHSTASSFLILLSILLSFPAMTGANTFVPDLTGLWDTTCNTHSGTTNITWQSGPEFGGTTLLDDPVVNASIQGNRISYTRDSGWIHQDYTGTLSIAEDGTATMAGTFTQADEGRWNWIAVKRAKVAVSDIPAIASLSHASSAIGQTVEIIGTGLLWVSTVKFNGTSANSITINSDTSITATVPDGAATGKVVVTSAGGTGTSTDDFIVYDLAQLEVMLDLGAEYIGEPGQVQLNYVLSGPQEYNGVLPMDGGGMALLTDLQPGTYMLTLSGSHWLKRVVSGLVLDGFLHENTLLTNGDSDGDGQINLFDFVVLDQNFAKTHAMADLDGSGAVNLFDYVIIDQNFGAQADTSP